jgi:hypothetical protein
VIRIPLLALAALAVPAAAEPEPEAVLTYPVFEITTPHLDLDECPEVLASDEVFCRAAPAHAEVIVFAFAYEGEQPLVGLARYAPGDFAALLR